jgi:hypothetical protein
LPYRQETEPTRPTTSTIYKLSAKQTRLGIIAAPDEATTGHRGVQTAG